MNLWIISAFDPTPIDNTRPMRFMGIADAALERGHRVTYFSNTFRHATREERFQERTVRDLANNYRLVFVYSKPYRGNLSFRRILSHHQFASNLLRETGMQPTPDLIFISLPPLSPVQKIATWARKQKIPVVVDIIDPWPDAFYTREKGMKAVLFKVLMLPFILKLHRILHQVTGITAISKTYVNWARSKTGNQIPGASFYPAVRFREIQEQLSATSQGARQENGILRVIYAGSLESSYDIPTILRASEILHAKHPGRIQFIIAGKGSQEELIRRAMKDLPNLEYRGRVDQQELLQLFSRSHVGLIQHKPGATQTVTYKLFDYLGAGLPIINSLKSEMAEIISENGVGFNHEPGDAGALASGVEQFYSDRKLLREFRENALKYTSEKGDAEVVYGELTRFLEEMNSNYDHVLQAHIKKGA